MNANALWNDHTFRVLLDDLFKARKDENLGPLRLEAIFRYCEATVPERAAMPLAKHPGEKPLRGIMGGPQGLNPVVELQPGERFMVSLPQGSQAPEVGPDAAFDLEHGDEVAATAKGYLEARRAERQDPEATLKLAADIVQKKVEEGAWIADGTMLVKVPRKYVVSGLEAILKSRRVPISAISCSIAPKKTHIDVNSASAISGSVGEGTGGWDILVTR